MTLSELRVEYDEDVKLLSEEDFSEKWSVALVAALTTGVDVMEIEFVEDYADLVMA